MSQMNCTQPTMYKFFCFKIEIKTKADSLHAMAAAMRNNGPLHQVLGGGYEVFGSEFLIPPFISF